MTTVAVVGSNGYIGKHVSAHLRNLGINVISMSSRDGSGLDPQTGLFEPGFSFNRQVDGVIYAAQSPQYRNVPDAAWHLLAVNSAAPLQIAMAAEKAGAKHFVYLSTGNVYRPGFEALKEDHELYANQWYPFSKIQGEQGLGFLKTRLQVNIVRVFAVYGPEQTDKLIANLIKSVESSASISLAPRISGVLDGGLRINPCYIDDAVDVLASLVRNGGPAVLNLAGPQVVDVHEIAETWALLRNLQPVFANSAVPRTMDLVANVDLLDSYVGRSLTPFSQGIARMAELYAASIHPSKVGRA